MQMKKVLKNEDIFNYGLEFMNRNGFSSLIAQYSLNRISPTEAYKAFQYASQGKASLSFQQFEAAFK
jgi:hypothetical protein